MAFQLVVLGIVSLKPPYSFLQAYKYDIAAYNTGQLYLPPLAVVIADYLELSCSNFHHYHHYLLCR